MFNNFADRLYVLRRLRGLNANEVAYKLGVAPATVSSWELGKTTPHFSVIKQIAKEYNCTLSWLFGETPIDAIEGAEK